MELSEEQKNKIGLKHSVPLTPAIKLYEIRGEILNSLNRLKLLEMHLKSESLTSTNHLINKISTALALPSEIVIHPGEEGSQWTF